MKNKILSKEISSLKELLGSSLKIQEAESFVLLTIKYAENALTLKITVSSLKIVPFVETSLEPLQENMLKDDLERFIKNNSFSLYPLVLLFINFVKETGNLVLIKEADFEKWNEENKLAKKVVKGKSGRDYFLENKDDFRKEIEE